MPDSVLTRAELAIDEARQLRAQREVLARVSEEVRRACRLAILESATMRVELRAYRNDKE